MPNRVKPKVKIDSEVLLTLIHEETSIRKIAKAIGWSDRTIRQGLKDGEMTIEIVLLLSRVLSIEPYEFADIDDFCNMLKSLHKKE